MKDYQCYSAQKGGTPHEYRLKSNLCNTGNPNCSISSMAGIVEPRTVPFPDGGYRGNGRYTLRGNPIMHDSGFNDEGSFYSTNRTLPGHDFHDGRVDHLIYEENNIVILETIGTGTGPNPAWNVFVGHFAFGRMHNSLIVDIPRHLRSLQ